MVRSVCLLRAAGFTWQAHHGGWVLSIIAKGTFDLLPTESRLSDRQEDIVVQDNHWNDDAQRSIYAPSDLAPFKPRADVMVVGHAFSPGGEPVRHLIARVVVGDADKSIEVVGERTLGPEGDVREGARFAKMPLRYERAAGGPETKNPVGMRIDTQDSYGRTPLPNLQPPGLVVSARGDFIEPIGFGPVAPSWSERRDRLAQFVNDFSPNSWTREPLPETFDFGYFNAAPRDLQIALLRDDERIVLENLHPEHARLVTSLPGVHPKAFVDREGSAPFPIRMTCDTLWIDTDAAIATLTWRAQLPVEHRQQPSVYIAMEDKTTQVWWADVEPLVRRLRTATKISQVASSSENRRAEAETERTIAPESDAPDRTLMPFGRGAESAALPFKNNRATLAIPVSEAPPESSTMTDQPVKALSAGAGAPAWLGGQSAIQPAPQAPQQPQPQPQTRTGGSGFPAPPAPPALLASVPQTESPWGAQPGLRASMPSDRPWAPQPPPPHPSGFAPPNAGPPSLERSWPGVAAPAPPAVVAHGAQAALGGVVAASDAAAAKPAPAGASVAAPSPSAPAPPVRGTAREYVELLWYDADKVRLVRSHRPFKEALLRRRDEEWLDAAEASPEPPEAKDRRDIYRVLSRGRAVDVEGISAAFVEAAEEEVFENPIVLVQGELQFYFDELETLKTTIGVAAPLAGNDKRLKDALDSAGEILKTRATPSIADGATTRIREAFVQSNRALSPNYLEATTERMLLEERSYQKRTMLGERRIRATLLPGGATSAVPCYLPEGLEKQLPLFPRIRVNVIATAVGQQDQNEAQPLALVAIALGRILPIPGRGLR